MISAFGVDHGGISKADGFKRDKKLSGSEKTAIGAGGAAATGGALAGTKIPEHSHFDRKTRKLIHSLPAGVHEVDTKTLAKRPRKLGARKEQTNYVAAMAKERPAPYSPVPVTRYKGKGSPVIQRDNAHSVMANAMTGRKTTIKIEDAPGYRPNRRTADELVRRGQMKYQQNRLKRNFNIGEKKINEHVKNYSDKARKANTHKRPHGVVEDTLSYSKKPFSPKAALGGVKALKIVAKSDRDRRNTAAGVSGAAGVGALASTPVRRSAAKVDVSGGSMSAKDARKVVSPGYRPGNKKAIKTMAANLGHLENSRTSVIQYKDGGVIPFDGNHRATARIARGDKHVPVNVIQGGERPAVSVTRNAIHGAQKKVHQNRMDRGVFAPNSKPKTKGYTGKHAGESKTYSRIANGSALRSGKRVSVESTRIASGPTKAVLRGKQGLAVGGGAALLGTAGYLHRKKD